MQLIQGASRRFKYKISHRKSSVLCLLNPSFNPLCRCSIIANRVRVLRACAPKRADLVPPGPIENKRVCLEQRMRTAENHGHRSSHRSDCSSYMSDRKE